MKPTKNIIRLLACTLATLSLLPACREEVDSSARYTFTGQTITGYQESHPQYSQYVDFWTRELVPVKVALVSTWLGSVFSSAESKPRR